MSFDKSREDVCILLAVYKQVYKLTGKCGSISSYICCSYSAAIKTEHFNSFCLLGGLGVIRVWPGYWDIYLLNSFYQNQEKPHDTCHPFRHESLVWMRIYPGEGLTLETSALESLYGGQLPLVINSVDKPNYTPHQTQHRSLFRRLPSYPFQTSYSKHSFLCKMHAEYITILV